MPMIETIDEYLMTAVHSESGIAVKVLRRSTYEIRDHRLGPPMRVKVRIDWVTDGGQLLYRNADQLFLMTDRGPQTINPAGGFDWRSEFP